MLKKIAGILMLLLGLFILGVILIINSGHTSSAFSKSDDIVGTLFGIILFIGGIYALKPNSKK
jgi:hypothetical protein